MDTIIFLNICVLTIAYLAAPSVNDSPKSVKVLDSPHCKKKATCISHSRPVSCFGTPLYSESSADYVQELFNNSALADFQTLQDHLEEWRILRNIPKCWQTLQPFLCALYMPKCEDGMVKLLSQEWCKSALATCEVLKEPEFAKKLPFLNCDRIENTEPSCTSDFKILRSNLSGECVKPLVLTDNSESQFDLINGCGVQCEDPKITREDHDQIHKMIAWGASISLLCNLFAVMSFLIGWRSGSKYPALIIFYINVCFLISNGGWLAQFLPKAREDIVCKKDNTLRRQEPSAGENLSCVMVFIAVYYFLMAACVWFVILTYAWHLSFRALGKVQERIDKKRAHFHLAAWSLPVVLTIIAVSLHQIDGNSATGICFVQSTLEARVGLVLVPISVTIIIGGYFLGRGLPFLFKIRKENSQILSAKASAKIRRMIVKIGIFSLLCFSFVVITFISHVYEFSNEEEWQKSFKKYIFCRILESNPNDCQMESRPSVSMIQFQLLVMFSAGIVMSSWVWTSFTVDSWKRFILKNVFKKEVKEEMKLEKHKIIRKAYEHRKELNYNGKIDLILNSYPDPLGWKFDLNSANSHPDSNFIKNVPKFIDRRGALVDLPTESNSRKSCDSGESITVSVRRLSVESRRHSLDSQISLHVSEVTATHQTNKQRSHRGKSKGKRRRRDFYKSRRDHHYSRRGSSTSQDSQINLKGLLTAIGLNNAAINSRNILKRRTGNAGLDYDDDSTDEKFPVPLDLSVENSHNDNNELSEGSNPSEEDFLTGKRGMTSDSDSESDDEEMIHRKGKIEKFRQKQQITATKALQMKKNELEYYIESLEQGKKFKRKPENRSHNKNKSNQTMMELVPIGDVTPKFKKERKLSDSDLEQSVVNKSGDKNKKYHQISKYSRTIQTNSNSESEYDEDSHLMQSVGVQIRSGSSRSKKSITVDVGTQISTQETSTQTDSHDYNAEESVNKSANQGTQMTPPLHIRLINKTLGTNGHSSRLKEQMYSFSSIKD